MTGLPAPEWDSCGKVRYPTCTEAQRALTALRLRDSRRRRGVYECPDCGGWHLRSGDKKTATDRRSTS